MSPDPYSEKNMNRKMTDVLAHLNAVGFRPKTIIDVGVAYGTPAIYQAFPDAYYFLFEPVRDFEPHLKKLMQKLRGEYQMCALGATDGDATIIIPQDASGSSLMHTGVDAGDPRLRKVDVRTLDAACGAAPLEGPVLLKTDCQGGDLAVIQGGSQVVAQCDVIIMELGMFHFWGPKTPDFTDVILHMKSIGFVPYDFFGYLARPSDGALGQIDVAFVKEKGQFRASAKW